MSRTGPQSDASKFEAYHGYKVALLKKRAAAEAFLMVAVSKKLLRKATAESIERARKELRS
jgi:hypothetical protein